MNAMKSVGLTPPDSIQLITNANISEFKDSFQKLKTYLKKQQIAKAPVQTFYFYFSGHSDERGLHLSDGLISKEELHNFFTHITVNSKVVFLDSCFSAALASKGLKPAKGFEIPVVSFDKPSGTVVLTSSASNGLSFESEELKGGLFSYYLIDGLYGRADLDSNGIVSVEELYQYVYSKLRFRTVNFPSGQQQVPEFVSDLKGKGLLAVAFPGATTSRVDIDDKLSGSIIFAEEKGLQIYRFFKDENQSLKVNVPPGIYHISIKSDKGFGTQKLMVALNKAEKIDTGSMQWTSAPQIEVQSKKGAQVISKTYSPELSGIAGISSSTLPGDQNGWFLGINSTLLYQVSERVKSGPMLSLNYSSHIAKVITMDRFSESASGTTSSINLGLGPKFNFYFGPEYNSFFALSAYLGSDFVSQKVKSEHSEFTYNKWLPSMGAALSLNHNLTLHNSLGILFGVDYLSVKSIEDSKDTKLRRTTLAISSTFNL